MCLAQTQHVLQLQVPERMELFHAMLLHKVFVIRRNYFNPINAGVPVGNEVESVKTTSLKNESTEVLCRK